jgi:peptidoglycan/LPS O-acetylase OafA/YrhL
MIEQPHSGRWDSLDALRGLAALSVVTFHCAQVFSGFAAPANPLHLSAWANPWSWLRFTPLRILVTGGPSAVVVFFVLSGFVLSLPFLRKNKPSYGDFLTKRFFRIYPPFVVAVLLSATFYALLRPTPIPALSEWLNTVIWDQPLSLKYIGRNLLMTGFREDSTLDRVVWSLVHELRISLFFPILFLSVFRWPITMMVMSVAASIGCSEYLTSYLGEDKITGPGITTLDISFIDTGRFVFLFIAGILLARNVPSIQAACRVLPRPIALAAWLAALSLLLTPGPSLTNNYNLIWGVGAVLLIALTVGSASATRILTARPLVWLGRVSYSLYLIHVPILVASVHLLAGLLPVWFVLAAVVIPSSLLAAEAMYRCVEVPSIRLGRALSGSTRTSPANFAAERSSL